MTSEVKYNYACVITQDICNKFIEVNFWVGCMVWRPNCLFQDWTFVKYWWDTKSKRPIVYIEALMASANTKALPKLDYRTFIVLFCPQDKCFYRFFFLHLLYVWVRTTICYTKNHTCWNVPEIIEHYLSNSKLLQQF